MKKYLLLVCIVISTALSSLLFNSCGNIKPDDGKKENPTDITARDSDYLKPSDEDDLIVFLYFDVIDKDYDKYDYYFVHNKAPKNKVKLNNPTIQEQPNDPRQDLEPSFITLNFGSRKNLKDADPVDYNFKIERIDRKDTSKIETLDEFKGKYNYIDLKKINSKIVIQSVKIKFNDAGYPGSIQPPIKPNEQP